MCCSDSTSWTSINSPALTATLRAARPDVLIGIDEEGGDVTRLGHRDGSPYPGNGALGATGDPGLTERIYRSIGRDLAAVGINFNLAPSVDVNTVSDNPIIGTRSFGEDPTRVAAHSAAAVAGLQAAGVAACAKHFPGHGATVADSHLELPVVDAPLDVLRARDLPPFAAAIKAGTKSIMTAHIRVPELTGDAPATFSHEALVTTAARGDGLHRRDRHRCPGNAGRRTYRRRHGEGCGARAGGRRRPAVHRCRRRSRAGRGDRRRCNRGGPRRPAPVVPPRGRRGSHGRTRRLGRTARRRTRGYGAAGLRTVGGSCGRRPPPRPPRPSRRRWRTCGLAAARRAIAIEGEVPPLAEALVVQLESPSTIAEGRVPWGVYPHVAATAGTMRLAAGATSAADLHAAADGRPIVIAGRNLHRLAGAAQLVEALAAMDRVVVVEMGWPSAWRPAGVAAFLTTYGASRANGRAAAEALGLAA